MEKYSYESISELNKTKNRWLFVSIAILAIAIGVFVLTCFLVNDRNLVPFLVLDCTILPLSASFCLFVILNFVLPRKNTIRHIQKVLSHRKENETLLVKRIDPKQTYAKDIEVSPVLLANESESKLYYLDADLMTDSFEVGDLLQIESANHFILKAEKKR